MLDEAIQTITNEAHKLQKDSDELKYINATLHVNFGERGRVKPNLLSPEETNHKALITVLRWYHDELLRAQK